MVTTQLNTELLFKEAGTDADEKVCVPVLVKEDGYVVSANFKDADAYLVVDFLYQKVDEISAVEMVGMFSSTDGAFKEMGLTGVICRDIFPMALKIFRDHSVEAYMPKSSNVEENLLSFINNKLIKITSAASGGGCLSNCSSCSTTCSTSN